MPTLIEEKSPLLEAVQNAVSKLIGTTDLDVVLKEVLQICVDAVGAVGGTIYLHNPVTHRLESLHMLPQEVAERLQRLEIPDNYGISGEVFRTGETTISTFPSGGSPHSSKISKKAGLTVQSMITARLAIEGVEPIGIIQIINKQDGDFTEEDKSVLDTVGSVCALAVSNTRFMDQRAQVASLESMGRTAHDLANKAGVLTTFLPDMERNLEALRGVLRIQGVRGEAILYLDLLEGTVKDVFAPYSERVYRYAKLINDLAAGKPLERKIKKMPLAKAVNDAAEYMMTQARRANVDLVIDLNHQSEEIEIDDLFVIRITENLIGNAIKAVEESADPAEFAEALNNPDHTVGKIVVRNSVEGDHHILEIEDEGGGIPPKTVKAILAGRARSNWAKNSGSGLGTKAIIELTRALGAKVEINSTLGEGTTFRISFPKVQSN